MHDNDEVDSEMHPAIGLTMSKTKSKLRCIKAYHYLLKRRNFWVLISGCLISSVVFSVTFYLNINHVYALYSNTYLPTPYEPSFEEQLELLRKSGILGSNSDIDTKLDKIVKDYEKNITYNDFNYLDSNTLTYENRTYSNNVQILFRLPQKRNITSLLLIFHGCSRSAYDWFHTIERQRIVGAAIDLGYGCLAFQANDRCWSSNIDINTNEDAQMVIKGLEKFYEEYPKLESLPRFTFGASSGGMFSSLFVINQRYKIQGQILFISIVLPEILETHVKEKTYPPTAWICMLRDIEFASEDRINASMQIFAREKIPYIGFDIEPISLTSTTFHKRIPTITEEASHYIFYRLQQNQWLDNRNYLIRNPRREYAWKTFIFEQILDSNYNEKIHKNILEHKNIIPDFLNTIYGEHEISFERSFEALTWHQLIYNNRTNLKI